MTIREIIYAQDDLRVARTKLKGSDLAPVARIKEQLRVLARMDAIASAFDALTKAAKAEAAAYEYQIHNEMGEAGYDIGDDVPVDGTKWGRQVDWYAKVQDPIAFKEWAAEHAEHLIQPKPMKALLNQLVQQAQEDGTELPPGIAADPKVWISRRGT